jgi:ABC-type multidrug transport system ATPase subunit
VSFLRAVITEPQLLFMDEPTVSVDKKHTGLMYEMIREFKRKGCTLIVVTHDPDLISWLADYLVVLDSGQVVESGPFDSVKNSSSPVVRSILSSVLAEAASYDTDILGLLSDE